MVKSKSSLCAIGLAMAFAVGCARSPGSPANSAPTPHQATNNKLGDLSDVIQMPNGVHPYFVAVMGTASSQDLNTVKQRLDSIRKSDRYNANRVLNEKPLDWTVHDIKVMDRFLVDSTAKDLETFSSEVQKFPGLRVLYRPVEQVQASLSLEVTDPDDNPMYSFALGDALNVTSLANADLRSPASYLFANGTCHNFDSACLKYLGDRGFLEDKQEFMFASGSGYQRRLATVRDILSYLLSTSLGKARGQTHAATKVSDNEIPWFNFSGFDKSEIVGGISLNISNVKFSELKPTYGSLPVNPNIIYTSAEDTGFLLDGPHRYLFQLPIYDINPIRSAAENSLLSLQQFYQSMLAALH